MGFGLGDIFKDIDSFDFFERIIGGGPGGFLPDDFGIDLQFLGIFVSIEVGLFPSPFSQEDRDNALPPVFPGQPPDTFETIIPDPPPERVVHAMQEMFDFWSNAQAGGGYRDFGYDAHSFLV